MKKNIGKYVLKALACLLVSLTVEIIVFNFHAVLPGKSAQSEEETVAENAAVSSETLRYLLDFPENARFLLFSADNEEDSVRAVRLWSEDADGEQTYIGDYWVRTKGKTAIPVYPGNNVEKLQIEIFGVGADDVFDRMAFSAKTPFEFRIGRFIPLLLIAALLFFSKELSNVKLFRNDFVRAVALSALCIFFVCVLLIGFPTKEQRLTDRRLLVEPPKTKGELQYNSDIHLQEADALLKGKLALDFEPDEDLLSLDNPYDPDEREGMWYAFDHALYNGHYYSYFGIAPAILLYIPLKLLTGKYPTLYLSNVIFAALTLLSCALAYFELTKRFTRKLSLPLYLLGYAACAAASGAFTAVSYADMYYVPVACAAFFAYLSVYFFLLGRRLGDENRRVSSSVVYALGGVSFVFLVMSRPSAAILPFAFLLFSFIGECRRGFKKLIAPALAAGIPLALGAGIVTYLNVKRFSSPFDFGAAYQLTISDINNNGPYPTLFGGAILHYFLQFPQLVNGGTLLFPSYTLFSPYGKFVYVDRTVGIFAFPVTLGLLFGFVGTDKRDRERRFLTAAISILAVVCAFSDFTMGGVNMRYLYDILPLTALTGTVVLLGLSDYAQYDLYCRRSVKFAVKVVFAAACVLSVFVGFGIVLHNAHDLVTGDSSLWFVKVTQFFRGY